MKKYYTILLLSIFMINSSNAQITGGLELGSLFDTDYSLSGFKLHAGYKYEQKNYIMLNYGNYWTTESFENEELSVFIRPLTLSSVTDLLSGPFKIYGESGLGINTLGVTIDNTTISESYFTLLFGAGLRYLINDNFDIQTNLKYFYNFSDEGPEGLNFGFGVNYRL